MDKKEVQKIEARSIAINDTPQSLPVSVDRSVFAHDTETKNYLKRNRTRFISLNK